MAFITYQSLNKSHSVYRGTWYYELKIDKGVHHNKPVQHPIVGVGKFYFELSKMFINYKEKSTKS